MYNYIGDNMTDNIDNIKKYGYIGLNELEIESIKDGVFYVNIKEKHLNPYGIVHGGLIYTLADTAMGASLIDVGYFVTINSSINFIKSAKCKKLIAKVKRIKVGKSIAFLECFIYDENNNLIATSNGSYHIYNAKPDII